MSYFAGCCERESRQTVGGNNLTQQQQTVALSRRCATTNMKAFSRCTDWIAVGFAEQQRIFTAWIFCRTGCKFITCRKGNRCTMLKFQFKNTVFKAVSCTAPWTLFFSFGNVLHDRHGSRRSSLRLLSGELQDGCESRSSEESVKFCPHTWAVRLIWHLCQCRRVVDGAVLVIKLWMWCW